MNRPAVVLLGIALSCGAGSTTSSDKGREAAGPPDASRDALQDGTAEVCEPDCEGKFCGPDGCGGSCGSCGSGQFCAVSIGRCVPDCTDAFEPDNDPSHAVPLVPGVPQDHSLCPPDDQDYLRVEVAWLSHLRIEVVAGPGVPLLLELLDGAGQPLNTSDPDEAGRAVIEWDGLEAGVYQVRVSLDEPGEYLMKYQVRLEATCVPDCGDRECGDDGCGGSCGECGPGFQCGPTGACQSSCADDLEPDDSPDQALAVEPGQSVVQTLCPPGDEDWHRITVAEPSHVRVRHDIPDGPGVEVYLLASTLTEEDFDLLVGQGQTVFKDIPAGTHFLMTRCEDWHLQVLEYRIVVEFLCAPDCGDRECGDDGCGGSCGECPDGAPCEDGVCACVPSCVDRQCGDDGCGGSCGECPPGFDCDDGVCVCEPQCAGKDCGPDGCGGSCGECDPYSTCDAQGVCASTCVDPFEPDAEPGVAHVLYPEVPRTHSICPGNDQDWFLFTLADDRDVTVRVSEAAAPVDLYLLDVNLVEEDFAATGPDGSGQAGPDTLPAGVYFVRVESSDPGIQVPTYRITVSVTGP